MVTENLIKLGKDWSFLTVAGPSLGKQVQVQTLIRLHIAIAQVFGAGIMK